MTQEKAERNARIRADWSAGLRPGIIARKYGVTRQRIAVICAGIEAGTNYPPEMESDDPRRDVEALGIQIMNVDEVKNV